MPTEYYFNIIRPDTGRQIITFRAATQEAALAMYERSESNIPGVSVVAGKAVNLYTGRPVIAKRPRYRRKR